MVSKEEALQRLEELFFNGKSPPPPTVNSSGEKVKLVLFIHGWSGSANKKTWGNFFTLFDNDLSLRQKYIKDPYTYYSPKINWKWARKLLGKKTPTIDGLAQGLKTTIDTKYKDFDSITLFCHSLGGLVAMRYLVSLKKQGIDHKIGTLVMYATPVDGSDFATIGQYVSAQIKQMCIKSEFLTALNEDWFSLKVFEDVETHYYIGDQDGVVDVPLATRKFEQEKTQFGTITNCDHRSVVKPEFNTDVSYIVLRDILMDIK